MGGKYASVIFIAFFLLMGLVGLFAKKMMDKEDQDEFDIQEKEKKKKSKRGALRECLTPGCYHTFNEAKGVYKHCHQCRTGEDMC